MVLPVLQAAMTKSSNDTIKKKSHDDDDDGIALPQTKKRKGMNVSKELLEYYKDHDVEGIVDYLNHKGGIRFIRLSTNFPQEETLELLQQELLQHHQKQSSIPVCPTPVKWLDSKLQFYAIPHQFPLQSSNVYRTGRVYGMDVSSGASIQALLLHLPPSENNTTLKVLDLCCAPGLKTSTIVDILQTEKQKSEIIGVDISHSRIHLCKQILQKYHVQSNNNNHHDASHGNEKNDRNDQSPSLINVQLFHTDGTTFGCCNNNNNNDTKWKQSCIWDMNIAKQQNCITSKRKRQNKSARARQQKQLRQLSLPSTFENYFHRVLVDAECSTDGALKHHHQQYSITNKNNNNKNNNIVLNNEKLLNPQELEKLTSLQKQLILNGYRLLRPGGTLLYSTCSLSSQQNEDVVSWLLQEYPNEAYIISLENVFSPCHMDEKEKQKITMSSKLHGTLLFHPQILPHDDMELYETDGKSMESIVKLSNTKSTNEKQRYYSQSILYGGGFYMAKIGKRNNHRFKIAE